MCKPLRNHITVKYRTARYHKGGEPVLVRKEPRCLGRSFRAYVPDNVSSVFAYVQHRMAQGLAWNQV